ncbi:hypothetical protein [Desulfosporosinus sp. SB140]|uniref:hypothetical protein n=1 Tax=Desulfosporosinus paludis TaxID=3115649 RepID=UPI00388FC1AE
MTITEIDENYLKQKLEWVKYRLEMLDLIEEKLGLWLRRLASLLIGKWQII